MTINSYTGMKETKSRFLSLSLPTDKKLGHVHSVFKTSFNISVENKLVNFSREGMSLSAHGCIVDKEKMLKLLSACRPGDIVRFYKGVFTLYTSTGVMKIDLNHMKEIDLAIPQLTLSKEEIEEAPLFKLLASLPFSEEMGLEENKENKEAFATLKDLSLKSEEEIKKAANWLIGRGKGLTPSGDDILSGFLMIRKAFKKKDAFETTIQAQLERRTTTDISMAYYDALFSGYVSSLFIALILSTNEEKENDVRELIHRIGLYGHTSGYDTLFGVYLGLQSLLKE